MTYRFASLTDFDFALVARTSVPATRLQALFRSNITALETDSIKLRTLQRQLSAILDDLDRHGIAVARSLRRTGIGMVSNDHGWRELFALLLHETVRDAAFARLVLVRYLEFLAERRAMLDALLVLKRASASACGSSPAPRGDPQAPHGHGDATAAPSRTSPPAGLARLPRGRAVVLELAAGRHVEIALARHRLALAHERDWMLVTEDGQRFVLGPGLNSVGRSGDNTVAVDGAPGTVSRTHFLAEPLGPDRIALTDLSSSGTFVTSTAIAS